MMAVAERLGELAGKVRARWRKGGLFGTLGAILRASLRPVVVYRRRFIWEAMLDRPLDPPCWMEGEKVLNLGPENLDTELTAELRRFLGGARAEGDLEGVRGGDRLFVVKSGTGYLYSGYIYFDTTAETLRQKKIFWEMDNTPVSGTSFTAPAARGKGIYRRALREQFRYLRERGYSRVTCSVEAENHASHRASAAAGMSIRRELRDWTFFKHGVLQKVSEGERSFWRLFWI